MSRRKKSEPQKIFTDSLTEDSDVEFQDDSKSTELPKEPEELLKQLRETPITELFEFHRLPRTYFIQKAKFERKEIDILVCDYCLKEFISAPGLNYHLMQSCPTRKRTRFGCLICEQKFLMRDQVLDHIKVFHLKQELSDNKIRSRRKGSKKFIFGEDYEKEDDTNKEEYNPGEEDVEDFDFIEDDEVKRPRTADVKKVTSNSKITNVDAVIEEFFFYNYDLEREYQSSLTEFLPDFLPKKDAFDASIEVNEVENCVRRFAKSTQFFIQREDVKKIVKPQTLTPFQAACVKKTSRRHDITFYVGGAVWAMDWCPYLICKTPRDQYLALSTHSNLHFFNTTYNESAIIQLWNCGKLKINNHEMQTPTMSLGLHHKFGPIWDLKWAPNGYKDAEDETKITRLGVLAGASASGVVIVFAVPLPEDLPLQEHPEKDDGEFYDKTAARVFKKQPDMILHPGPNTTKEKNVYGQCLKVDWNKHKQSELVAGGFSTGFVAIWKVVDPSKLLTKTDNECTEIIACRVFRAHSKPVRGIAWCPFDGDVLATGSYDRFFKVWNINNTECPRFDNGDFNSSTYTDIVWPAHWCGVYAATDEVFAVKYHRGAIYISAYEDSSSYVSPVLPFKGPCWSLSCSDWLNFVCAGDIMGNLCIFNAPNWNKPVVKSSRKCPRLMLYSVKEEQDENLGSTLVFHDTNMGNLRALDDRMAFQDVKRYEAIPDHSYTKPLTSSINCTKWNANFGSHTWIASGLHCGLVRLNCIHSVHSKSLDLHYANIAESIPT